MQEYIKKIHRTLEPNAMIVTSRKQISIGIGDEVFFEVLPMSKYQISQYTNRILTNTNSSIFNSKLNRALLLQSLYKNFYIQEKELPISPTLVRLFLNKVITLENTNTRDSIINLLSQLPTSIPDIYTDYLIATNTDSSNSKFFDENILEVAEIVADLSIGSNFKPKDVLIKDINTILNEKQIQMGDQLVLKFINNGTLSKRRYANDYFVRFNLDTLAEYLSAFKKAKLCGSNIIAWKELYDLIISNNAKEYFEILQIIHMANGTDCKWPTHNQLEIKGFL